MLAYFLLKCLRNHNWSNTGRWLIIWLLERNTNARPNADSHTTSTGKEHSKSDYCLQNTSKHKLLQFTRTKNIKNHIIAFKMHIQAHLREQHYSRFSLPCCALLLEFFWAQFKILLLILQITSTQTCTIVSPLVFLGMFAWITWLPSLLVDYTTVFPNLSLTTCQNAILAHLHHCFCKLTLPKQRVHSVLMHLICSWLTRE